MLAGACIVALIVVGFAVWLLVRVNQADAFADLSPDECRARGGHMAPKLVETPTRAYYDYSEGLHCEPGAR